MYQGAEVWSYGAHSALGDRIVAQPWGHNLLHIARHNQEVYDFLKELVGPLGWKVRFDLNTKLFRLSEVRADEILDYNLELLSDSLKRFFFYGAVLLTSQDATLVLDGPDVYAFPPYRIPRCSAK